MTWQCCLGTVLCCILLFAWYPYGISKTFGNFKREKIKEIFPFYGFVFSLVSVCLLQQGWNAWQRIMFPWWFCRISKKILNPRSKKCFLYKLFLFCPPPSLFDLKEVNRKGCSFLCILAIVWSVFFDLGDCDSLKSGGRNRRTDCQRRFHGNNWLVVSKQGLINISLILFFFIKGGMSILFQRGMRRTKIFVCVMSALELFSFFLRWLVVCESDAPKGWFLTYLFFYCYQRLAELFDLCFEVGQK